MPPGDRAHGSPELTDALRRIADADLDALSVAANGLDPAAQLVLVGRLDSLIAAVVTDVHHRAKVAYTTNDATDRVDHARFVAAWPSVEAARRYARRTLHNWQLDHLAPRVTRLVAELARELAMPRSASCRGGN